MDALEVTSAVEATSNESSEKRPGTGMMPSREVEDGSTTSPTGNDDMLPAQSAVDSTSDLTVSETTKTLMGPPSRPASRQNSSTQQHQHPEPNSKTQNDHVATMQSGETSSKNQNIDRQTSDVSPNNEHNTTETNPNETSTLGEPRDELEAFNWRALEERYHDKMNELNEAERQTLSQFSSLSQFFAVWARTSQRHEVDRSFKRLKTRMAYVQHNEEVLEEKRQHYIKVVQAFEDALALLS